jgi:hypothetical protein
VDGLELILLRDCVSTPRVRAARQAVRLEEAWGVVMGHTGQSPPGNGIALVSTPCARHPGFVDGTNDGCRFVLADGWRERCVVLQ